MITNAAILSIATPSAPDGAGDVTYSTGPAIQVRCLTTSGDALERFELDQSQRRGMTVLTVLRSILGPSLIAAGYAAGLVPAAGQIWSVRTDGDAAPISLRVEDSQENVKGPVISHWRVTLRSV